MSKNEAYALSPARAPSRSLSQNRGESCFSSPTHRSAGMRRKISGSVWRSGTLTNIRTDRMFVGMMKITGFYPVLASSNVSKSKDFYERLFGLQALFSSEWYAHLAHPEDKRVELALVAKDHETIPLPGRTAAAGLLINFEVSDVDQE